MKNRWFVIAGTAAILALGTVLFSQPGGQAQPPAEEKADGITLMPSSIHKLSDLEVKLKDQPLKVAIAYAQKGNARSSTVFALPVWVVMGNAERMSSAGASASAALTAASPLLPEGENTPVRLRLRLRNLLAGGEDRKAVLLRLKQEIAEEQNLKPESITIYPPRARDYRVALYASGAGDDKLPAEVPLSRSVELPPILQEQPGGEDVSLELLPENIRALEAFHKRPLLVSHAYLVITGSLQVQFEKKQYEASFTVLSQALTNLQNHLRSIAPSASEAPEALLQVPLGGEVSGGTTLGSFLGQYLVGTISVREGEHDLGALNELADKLMQRVLQQVRVADLEDKKRVAVMLGNQATLSATVGELRSLSKKTKAEREQHLKDALEDFHTRSRNQESQYKGAVGVRLLTVGVDVSAAAQNRNAEAETKKRKQEMEMLQRGLDEVGRRLDGRLPVVSGIRFDQDSLAATVQQYQIELQKNTFTTGWSRQTWPRLKLHTSLAAALSPELLAEQNAQARQQYEQFALLLKTPDRLRTLETASQRVEKLENQLTALLDDWKKTGPPESATLKRELADLKTNLAAVNKSLARLEQRAGSVDSLGMRFVQLNKGTFWMGGGNGKPGEKQVEIKDDFQMGVTEVTQGQWKSVMKDTDIADPSRFKGDDLPVEQVSWDDTQKFIKRLNELERGSGWTYRLPTEAEWEYACRGGASSKEECSFHFYFQRPTNDLSWDQASFDGRGPFGNGKKGQERTSTIKVGSFEPNRLGLYDMHGNVWEWCQDLYGEGPARVIRGGGWCFRGSLCWASYRDGIAPPHRDYFLGLRLARVPVK